MAIQINGSGTLTGVSVGGLPDGIVDADMLASNSVQTAKIADDAVTDAKENLSGAAKAWIRYKIDSSGVTNQDSFGIAGAADNGLGDVILTFTTAMANDDYVWSFVTGVGMWNGNEGYATTTTLRLRNMTRNDSYTNADSDINACAVFGDQ